MTTVNQYRVWCTDIPAHYEYVWGTTAPTVCPSDGGPIDTNLTTVVQTVSSTDVEITNLPRSVFGDLSTTEMTPIVQLYFTYNNAPQEFTSGTVGSGSVTNANSMGVVSSGAAINSSAYLRSIKPIKYHSGQGIVARYTAVFTVGVAGNQQLAGLYDSDNGIGFGFNETSFGVFHRKNTTTTWIPQTSWNRDKLDGTGTSGVNINFSSGFGNVFELQYQYLGFGSLIFCVENPSTGEFILVHRIEYPNTSTTPSFGNPSFPLCIESANTTNNTDISVKTASMMAAVQGKLLYMGPTFTSVWNNIAVSNGTETFIAAWQVKSTFQSKTNKSIVYATSASFATGSTDKAQILRLRKGVTFTSPVWTDVNTSESCVQRLTGGSWNSGTGTVVYQQNIAGAGTPTTIDIIPSPTTLYGVAGDNLVITLEGLGGAGSNWGSLRWLEDQ